MPVIPVLVENADAQAIGAAASTERAGISARHESQARPRFPSGYRETSLASRGLPPGQAEDMAFAMARVPCGRRLYIPALVLMAFLLWPRPNPPGQSIVGRWEQSRLYQDKWVRLTFLDVSESGGNLTIKVADDFARSMSTGF